MQEAGLEDACAQGEERGPGSQVLWQVEHPLEIIYALVVKPGVQLLRAELGLTPADEEGFEIMCRQRVEIGLLVSIHDEWSDRIVGLELLVDIIHCAGEAATSALAVG